MSCKIGMTTGTGVSSLFGSVICILIFQYHYRVATSFIPFSALLSWPDTAIGATQRRRPNPQRLPANLSSLHMYQQVKGVIFDIDGTLVDSWKLGYDATLVILDKHKIEPITEEHYHECTRYATPERLARHAGLLPGDADYESVGRALAQEFDDLYIGLVSRETTPFFPETLELIHSIPSHIRLGAFTNAAERYAHAVLQINCPALLQEGTLSGKKMSIYKRFESVRGADTVPKPKPHPDGLIQVCQELNLRPDECVYIGDSPSDAVCADQAGMPSIGVVWGSHGEESLSKAPFSRVVGSMKELRSLLPR